MTQRRSGLLVNVSLHASRSGRASLIVLWVVIACYTAVVAANHGMNLLPIFFGDMTKLEWPGQFNLDFMSMLALSGLWVAWRHRFSAAGLALGLLALFRGAFWNPRDHQRRRRAGSARATRSSS